MMGYWDRDLHNAVADTALATWFGFTVDAIKGTHLSAVIGETAYQESLPQLAGVLAGAEQHWTRQMLNSSGETRTAQVALIPHTRDGEVRGFISLFTDLTETLAGESQAKDSLERYRALARSIPSVFVLLYDADLRHVVAEGQALTAFGFHEHHIEGRTLFESLPHHRAVELEPRYRSALAGTEVTWTREVGDRVFSLKTGPVETEGVVSAGMVVAMDITKARQREQSWAALHEISTAVARSEDTASVTAKVSEVLRRLFLVDNASVIRFAPSGSVQIVAVSPNDRDIADDVQSHQSGSGLATDIIWHTGNAAIAHYDARSEGGAGVMFGNGFRASAAAPIHVLGDLWGAVVLSSRTKERVSEEVLGRLSEFANLVEIAIGNTQARAELEQQAKTDTLTGLPNRRTFQARLDLELSSAAATGQPLSLVVFDVDHFKSVNDTHGHSTGDLVLAEIARRLRRAARHGEMLARLGGEEFVWLLPGVAAEQAQAAAERAGLAVASERFAASWVVTVSSGVCDLASAGAANLLDCADMALFEAKRQGRNRSVAYRAPSPE